MSRETAQQIDAEAALWAARADRGLTPAEDAQFQQWLAEDPRRPGAYARMSWTMIQTERAAALGADFEADQDRDAPHPVFRRRNLIVAGAAAMAASVVGGLVWRGTGTQLYETRKGERRVVVLQDGSTLTLNTATRIEVAFSAGSRDLRLIAGEALFDVAKDRARPFRVTAGDTDVVAVGTSFTVDRAAPFGVRVIVREGVVEVARAAGPKTRVASGNSAIVREQAAAIEISPIAQDALGRELAWRNGQLIFSGETLDAAAARFWNYSDIKIVIDDRALGGEEISGIFDASDPIGFANSVSLSLNARAVAAGREVHIRR